jgi:hypothetical protein
MTSLMMYLHPQNFWQPNCHVSLALGILFPKSVSYFVEVKNLASYTKGRTQMDGV